MLSALTVRAHEPSSHKDTGWERLTDAVVRAVNDRPEPIVFVLWGGDAKKKRKLVTAPQYVVIESAHPSPLSARRSRSRARALRLVQRVVRALERAAVTLEHAQDARVGVRSDLGDLLGARRQQRMEDELAPSSRTWTPGQSPVPHTRLQRRTIAALDHSQRADERVLGAEGAVEGEHAVHRPGQ